MEFNIGDRVKVVPGEKLYVCDGKRRSLSTNCVYTISGKHFDEYYLAETPSQSHGGLGYGFGAFRFYRAEDSVSEEIISQLAEIIMR